MANVLFSQQFTTTADVISIAMIQFSQRYFLSAKHRAKHKLARHIDV